MKEKNYVACAKLAEENLASTADASYSVYAADANLRIGLSLPPEKGKKYLARALWYFRGCETYGENPALKPLNQALAKLHLMWPLADTYVHLGSDELLSGDLAAAAGYFNNAESAEASIISWPVQEAISLRQSSSCLLGDPNKIKAIPLLERQLAILEEAHGKNGPKLESLMLNLADCYRSAGQEQKAINAYERYFSIASKTDFACPRYVVSYCDLLTKNKRGKEVPSILLRHLRSGQSVDRRSPLFIFLIESYAKQNMKQQAADALRTLVIVPHLPDWDADVIRAEQGPVYYVLTPMPKNEIPRPASREENQTVDPFGAYSAGTKSSSSTSSSTPPISFSSQTRLGTKNDGDVKSDESKEAASDSGF
jgi:tetratricopeptide (TPR) repeat protein